MTARTYRATWDDIATLDADHIASWGALAGYQGVIEFDGLKPSKIHAEHDRERDTLSAFYVWKGGADAPIRSTVRLERRPCRFGGTRAYFRCPRCARATLRLAVLASGLMCGTCGRITWKSRRLGDTARLVRRADKLAGKLGLGTVLSSPRRPARMRLETYARIVADLAPMQAEINRRLALRAARSKTPLGHLTAALRWGL
ncbi:MAG: hypothetical protein NT015_08360 [Alphaproteobacteria bacterium]|nr:hypothetical protein [Alphaproteobacteria bacterium]